MAQVFWRRLSKDYVSLLQSIYKWTPPETNIRESDLVTCSDFLEKDKWLLYLVRKVIHSNDRL